MDTMLTYNTNSNTGPVCGGRPQYIGALKNYHINILELDRILGNTYGKETH